jgi:hypothetical protein
LNPHALAGTSPSSDRAPCGLVWRDEVSRGQVLFLRCVRVASLGLVRGDFAGLVSNGVSTASSACRLAARRRLSSRSHLSTAAVTSADVQLPAVRQQEEDAPWQSP